MRRTNSRRGAAAQLLRTTPVAAAAAAVLATSAWAQDAAPSQTVTITGIRRGIESAINVKKNSDVIVEAISAEDIGKLPDNSIAESIARLPGLSAQRVAGRAQVISVRGLSPDFATTLLNGRELVSTGDNRSVEFDQYPSELLSGVTIFKTPYANLVGQGLSGTIDMQTVRPLNFGQRTVALGARLLDNSLGAAANAKRTGNRVSASYIDQFANRTVGLAIGYAHQETPVQENQVGLYEPWQVKGYPGFPANTYGSDGIKALRRTGKLERDGLMATLEIKASKEWTSVVDYFHSEAKQTDTANQFEVHVGGYNGGYGPPNYPAFGYSNVTVDSNSTYTSATVASVYPLVRGMYNTRKDKIDALGWNNKFKLAGFELNADANWSKATRRETNLENNTQLVPAPQIDTIKLQIRQDDFSQLTPGLNYADPTQLFLRGTIYGSGYGKTPSVQDELGGLRLSAKTASPGMISGWAPDLEFGLNYADRKKVKHQPEGGINVGAQGDTPIAPDLQYGLVDLAFAGVGKIPSWNVPAAVARYMTFNPDETSAGYLIAKAWTVKEKIATGFAQANIDSDIGGGMSLRGNVGLQVQSVDQSSQSRYFDNSAPAGQQVKPFNNGKTYTDVLPALNLAFGLPGDQTVRLAVARQVARPRVDQLRSSLDYGVDSATGRPGASGGNPRLDPWRANALDVSYEKYFGTKAYVAAAAFYKDLKTYIYTQGRDYDFSDFIKGYVPPNTCTVNGQSNQPCPTPQRIGTLTAPYNGNGGKLKGLELTASLPLNLVTPALSGFGIVVSYSYNDSNIAIQDPDSATSVGSGNIALPGLSKNVANLTAYYEAGGFEFRVSQRHRSDYIGEIGNFAGNRTLRYVVGENITDAQVGYSFNEGSLKGLSLLLQVNNINNAAYRTYAGTKDRPLEYIKWGRQMLAGANYKF